MEETASDIVYIIILTRQQVMFGQELCNIPSLLLQWFLDVPIFHYSSDNETQRK